MWYANNKDKEMKMKTIEKHAVQSLRNVKVGHMLTMDYGKKTQHAMTVIGCGVDTTGTPWALLADRSAVELFVSDDDLNEYDIKAVNKYV
jgi:hypothetical protein